MTSGTALGYLAEPTMMAAVAEGRLELVSVGAAAGQCR
jgi:hypothetical protein